MFYRGIKVTPQNVVLDKKVKFEGIYRGTKFTTEATESSTMKSGTYRGTSWAA